MWITKRSLTLPVAALAVVALAAGPALATEPFCVTYDGFDGGPSNDPPCPTASTTGWEYHHLVARDYDAGPPGPTRHYLVIFTKSPDNATTVLWERLDTGNVIASVTFVFPAGPPLQQSDFIVTLTNARVIGIEPIVAHAGDTANDVFGNQERIRMNYESMTIERVGGATYTITP